MADISKTVAIIFEAQNRASAALADIEKGLVSLETEAGDAGAKVKQAGAEIDELGTKGSAVDKISVAMKALAASLIIKDFIDANLAFEKFSQSMTATTGSAKAAAAEFEYVRGVSNRLGIETRSTAEAYAKFAASVKGTSLEGEGARLIFEGFAGTMSRVGSSSADISGAFVQLAQGISKGRFELEDLKSIAERVPGFFDAFSKSLGVSTAELFKMISAGQIGTVEIKSFADSLNASLDGATFDGYAQSFARLKNAINDTYLIVGNAGAWDVLTKGLQLGAAAVTGTIASFTLLGEIIGAVFAKMANPASFDLGAAIDDSMAKAARTTQAASEALLGVEKTVSAVGTSAATAGGNLHEGFTKGALSAKELETAAREVDKQLKLLGIDPKLFNDPVKDISAAFTSLAANAAASGEQIVVGLIGALQNLPAGAGLADLTSEIEKAFKAGKLSAEEYGQAMALIKVRMDDASPSFIKAGNAAATQTKNLADNEKQTRDAEKATRDYALELEKLASNERIKFIEANVKLNVAQVEADTKRIEAAFASINSTINSTGDVIGKIFGSGAFANGLSAFDPRFKIIEEQLSKENALREKAFNLQERLTAAQIKQMEAQTSSILKGDGLIKIDGAGLQPHLEAFMWEILKAIQVRVNAQGLSLLLGV